MSVVVINGWYRTGSTKCFHAAIRLLEEAGFPVRREGMDFAAVDNTIADHLKNGKGWLVIKSHNWMPRYRNDSVVVLHTIRDPADVVRSGYLKAERKAQETGIPFTDKQKHQQAVHMAPRLCWYLMDLHYMRHVIPMHSISYEEFYGRDIEFVTHLADLFGVTLSAEKVRLVADEINVDRVKAETEAMEEAIDPATHLRKRHISDAMGVPNGSLDDLPEMLQNLIRNARAEGADWSKL